MQIEEIAIILKYKNINFHGNGALKISLSFFNMLAFLFGTFCRFGKLGDGRGPQIPHVRLVLS